MSIYITGDCHGTFTKFSKKNFPIKPNLTRDDTIIVTGDFGVGPWGRPGNDNQKEWDYWLKWLSDMNATIAFVDGNHENFITIESYPVELWNGGRVHRVTENIVHLMRGEIFTIEGKTFFAFGGARSHDIDGGILDRASEDFHMRKRELDNADICYRILNETWWEHEMPSAEEMEYGLKQISQAGWQVDYIITHCGPYSVEKKIGRNTAEKDNPVGGFFEQIMAKCAYKQWLMGHYHEDTQLPDEKIRILYDDILYLGEQFERIDSGKQFKYGERVAFSLTDGGEEMRGTILHINRAGDGMFVTDEPVANIYSDSGRLYKNVAFSRMRKV